MCHEIEGADCWQIKNNKKKIKISLLIKRTANTVQMYWYNESNMRLPSFTDETFIVAERLEELPFFD